MKALFTKSQCPKCVEMKNQRPQFDVEVNCDIKENLLLAQKYHVMSVPALIDIDDTDKIY